MPTWRYTVDLKGVWRNEEMTFEERRDEIVRRLRESRWFKSHEEGSWLHSIVEELADTESIPDFDRVFNAIYDEADADRAWIATF